jgi:hypothetical protein
VLFFRLLQLTAAVFVLCNSASGADVEVAIHPHVRQVVFGDPLYVEVTILNRGATAITRPAPHPDLSTFAFRVSDPTDGLDLDFTQVRVGGEPPVAKEVRFEPGIPVKYYWYLFLPDVQHFDDPFWAPVRKGRELFVSGVYGDGSRKFGWGDAKYVRVVPRDDEEIRTLERWKGAGRQASDHRYQGPGPSDFGLQFLGKLNRQQTAEIAAGIKTGELADLLRLTVRMQDIYAATAGGRETLNRDLAKWVSNQPDVMREALANKLQSLATAHGLSSTARALQTLADRR